MLIEPIKELDESTPPITEDHQSIKHYKKGKRAQAIRKREIEKLY
jgi:hypothetical protein